MKHIALYLFMLLFVVVHAQTEIDELVAAESKRAEHLHKGLRSLAIDNSNIIYTRLELQVDPAVKYINGKVTHRFIPRQAIGFVEFDLTDSLTVDSVKYHGSSLLFTHLQNDLLHVELPAAIVANIVDSLTIYYQGVPVGGEGFGSFMQMKHGEDSVPVIWTLSEPYGAKDWWPCKNNLNDKIDSLDVWVTCPQQYRVASNGLLIDELQQGTNITYKWKHRYPIATYLVAFAVTNYSVFSLYAPLGNDTLEILNYIYPEGMAHANEELPKIIPQIQLYDSLFGAYPFIKEKYGHAQFGWGGGMEHQTMSFMYNFGYELMAHELAHHWFGDKVTCSSWQEIWLNEGFATFLASLCYEHIQTQYWEQSKRLRIKAITEQTDGAVFCYDTTDVGNIFNGKMRYLKGSMVLQTMRWVVGDEAFFNGLRSYLNDVSNAYAFATTSELKQHMEAASGMDLTDFFDTWIYKEGYPSYQIEWSQDFKGYVEMKVSQTQSHPSVDYFRLNLPIKFKTDYSDTTIVVSNMASGSEYKFTLPFMADSLLFDPDHWIISANNTIIKKAAYNFHMLLYPNPAQEYIEVRIESEGDKDIDLCVYNASGSLLYKEQQHIVSGTSTFMLNTSSYAPGVYSVKVKASNDRKPLAEKFIKAAN